MMMTKVISGLIINSSISALSVTNRNLTSGFPSLLDFDQAVPTDICSSLFFSYEVTIVVITLQKELH